MILQGFDNANLSFINSVRKDILGRISLSLVSQFVIFFICKAKIHKFHSKIHKFSVIANESQGEVWQSIVKSGFYRFYFVLRTRNTFFATQKTATPQPLRKNSLTLIFARNDGVAKIHNFHNFFSNFHSKRFQNFEKFNTKESKIIHFNGRAIGF